jgi:hypothetical protein
VQTLPARSRGACIIRKPLGTSTSEHALSCWGWYVDTLPELTYAAHDFDGGAGDEVRIRAQLPTGVNGHVHHPANGTAAGSSTRTTAADFRWRLAAETSAYVSPPRGPNHCHSHDL